MPLFQVRKPGSLVLFKNLGMDQRGLKEEWGWRQGGGGGRGPSGRAGGGPGGAAGGWGWGAVAWMLTLSPCPGPVPSLE